MQWYYARDGVRHGPFEEDRLSSMARSGRLRPDDHVWNETMGDRWAEASSIEGLFSKDSSAGTDDAPPPLPVQAIAGSDEHPWLPASERISVIAPIAVAWRHMVFILFRTFDIGKWFAMAFSGWLACLGEGHGGFSTNWNWKSDQGDTPWNELNRETIQQTLEEVRMFLVPYRQLMAWALPAAAVMILLFLVVGLWIRSRGKFMFLDNVVHNRGEIKEPWGVFAEHGNSLFRWTLVFRALALVLQLPILALAATNILLPAFREWRFDPAMVPTAVLCGVLWLVTGVVLGYVSRFLEDFVIPIMYRLDLTAMEAWGRFLSLLKGHFWRFVWYGIFHGLLAGVAGSVAVMAMLIACCCLLGCLLVFPYLGAVVVLPLTVFFRAYSLSYLAQFGEDYEMDAGGERV